MTDTWTTRDIVEAFGNSTILPTSGNGSSHNHYAFALPPSRDQPRPGVRGKDREWTLADVCIYLTALELLPAFSSVTITADAVRCLRESVAERGTWAFRAAALIRHNGTWTLGDTEEAMYKLPDGVTTVLSIEHIEHMAYAALEGAK